MLRKTKIDFLVAYVVEDMNENQLKEFALDEMSRLYSKYSAKELDIEADARGCEWPFQDSE